MDVKVNLYPLLSTAILCVLFTGVLSDYGDRYCNKTIHYQFQTPCIPCAKDVFQKNCPDGAAKMSTVCQRTVNLGSNTKDTKDIILKGCIFACAKIFTLNKCCDGYWGPNCDECPGGSLQPCSGNGVCNDTKEGTGECACQENFTGFACEKCANDTLYGYNCDKVCNCTNGVCDNGRNGTGSCNCDSGWRGDQCDEWIEECNNKTCDENSRCLDYTGYAKCYCNVGFERDISATNQTCNPINACEKSTPCDSNANCISIGPDMFNCSCNSDYYGDGFVCAPVDPCQTNNGGCESNSSICIYTGPGQQECECKDGYEGYTEGVGCDLVDVCVFNSSYCDENAECETTGPLQFECKCKPGYSGDGRICYNNMFDLIEDLNKNDPDLKGKMQLSSQWVQKVYYKELRYHGPFTVFLPTDRGFRTILRKMTWESFMADTDLARQILRQHIIVGEWTLHDLGTADKFYTLQGNPAEIAVKNRGDVIYRYRLHGSRNKATVVKGDILAANGVIHVLGKLLTNEPEIKGDSQKTILELIKKEGQYNRMETLIMKAGMTADFSADNITVFASSNLYWDNLPEGTLEYLQSPEGLEKLKLVLQHHIVDGVVEVADMINTDRIKTKADFQIAVVVTEKGQIRLDRKINISQTDIPAKNGLYYHIEGILLPISVNYLLPSQCDTQTEIQVQGPCTSCNVELKCKDDSHVDTGEIVTCYFSAGSTRLAGCAKLCNATIENLACCPGFFGSNCEPCQGGFKFPCSGRGQCSDGIKGNGTCMCEEAFSGPNCEQCSDPNMFGPNCTQPCTCVHGDCNSGVNGDGKCKICHFNKRPVIRGSKERFFGENCDRVGKLCGWGIKTCHIHSTCVLKDRTSLNVLSYSCLCDPGYEGDGRYTCSPINPCSKSDRGGCSTQAVCDMTGPGTNNCTCSEGFSGDGTYCYPGSKCKKHEGCDKNASCQKLYGHTKTLCVCKDGFHGNGTYCVPTDTCQYNNGGCHAKANCTSTGPGKNNCTCISGYGGNGVSCVPTISQFILDDPGLTILAQFLKLLGEDNLLQYVMDDYTFFAPTDKALKFMMSRYVDNFWKDEDNIINFINFHTLLGMKTTEMLMATSQGYIKYETLYDGFYIHVYSDNETMEVSARNKDRGRSRILTENIPTLNGYVNIIDRALEPFLPDEDTLILDEFFESHPEYSMFGDWLQKKGLLEMLMDMNQYTLFVPTNDELQKYSDKTVTADFLKYYVLPHTRLSSSFTNKETVDTMLGPKHRLYIQAVASKVFVNKEMIDKPDMLTLGGVVHGIMGILSPVLHKCDIVNNSVVLSECDSCLKKYFTCPAGYKHIQPVELFPDCLYDVKALNVKLKGCVTLCRKSVTVKGCCAGYYGANCDECPGGPEFPCNNNGACSDGLTGDGTCSCYDGYTGEACQSCIKEENKTIACSRSCSHFRGGCSENATCEEYMGDVTCICNIGLVGDGSTCVSPCQVDNGGCSEFASCLFSEVDGSKNCTCNDGFFGDGKTCHKPPIKQSQSSDIDIALIVGPIIGALVLILALIFIIILVRHRGMIQMPEFSRVWQRKGSVSSVSFAQLNPAETEEVSADSISQPSSGPDVNFDNPLYNVKDEFTLDS